METDASDYVSAGILSQYGDDGILHPIAFFSKKHSPAECNYEIYDKELMAIVKAFEEWRPELEGAAHPIQVLSDHKNLEYFMSTKLLNRRQARWSEFLSRFDFKIVYRPGKAGAKPDALTRRSGDLPQEEGDERITERQKAVLKPQNLPNELRLLADIPPPVGRTPLESLLVEAYETDPFPQSVLDDLAKGTQRRKDISLSLCAEANGRLHYDSRLFVPNHDPLKLHLFRTYHDSPTVGHQGVTKTYELLSREYYWTNMRRDIERYLANCHTCKRTKTRRHQPYGELRPLPVPEHPWQHISWDFVTGLPEADGKDAVLVVVCRLTKMRHLIPCSERTSAKDLADLFVANVWRLHGLPETIVSDRGSTFASEFWSQLCSRLGIQPRLSTAFHQQTNGQTERMNAIFEAYLRAYVAYQQDDWLRLLPLAEFVGNNTESETIGTTLFFANSGCHPKMNFELDQPAQANLDALDADSQARRLQEIHEHCRVNMRWAQDRYKEFADRNRLPAPVYRPGDKVWLDARNITTTRPCRKLDYKRLGPFTVKRAIGSHAYELDLPATLRIHPVQHTWLLEPAREDPFPGQVIDPPPPVEVDGEIEHHVQEIVDCKLDRRRRQPLLYRVRWTGYHEDTWEPAENINGLEAIDLFHQRYPDKPGPLPEDPVGQQVSPELEP